MGKEPSRKTGSAERGSLPTLVTLLEKSVSRTIELQKPNPHEGIIFHSYRPFWLEGYLTKQTVTSLEISIHFILHISPEKSLKATLSQSRCDSVVLNLLPSLEGRLFFMHSNRLSMSSWVQRSGKNKQGGKYISILQYFIKPGLLTIYKSCIT